MFTSAFWRRSDRKMPLLPYSKREVLGGREFEPLKLSMER